MIGNDTVFFVDEVEVFRILHDVSQVGEIYKLDWNVEKNFNSVLERLTFLLTKYLEQPAILNNSMLPMLSILCSSLLKIAEKFQKKLELLNHYSDGLNNLNHKSITELEDIYMMNHFHAISQCIQLLCRVRGFKHVLKYFPVSMSMTLFVVRNHYSYFSLVSLYFSQHEVLHLELCVMMLRLQVIRS